MTLKSLRCADRPRLLAVIQRGDAFSIEPGISRIPGSLRAIGIETRFAPSRPTHDLHAIAGLDLGMLVEPVENLANVSSVLAVERQRHPVGEVDCSRCRRGCTRDDLDAQRAGAPGSSSSVEAAERVDGFAAHCGRISVSLLPERRRSKR